VPRFPVWDVLRLSGLSEEFDTVLDSGLFHTIADPTEIGSSTIQDGDPARRPLLHAVSQRSAAGTPGLASDNAGRNQNQPPRMRGG
jgi:hypothetical protein